MKTKKEFIQLVAANRILANENVVDAFGHVSIRHPDDPDRYVMSRSRAPELVELEDLMEFGLDGIPVDESDRTPYGERFIHGAVMETRTEVNAVVHNHSYEVLPFTITNTPLVPVIHSAAVIGHSIPVWDIRDQFGESTDLLIKNMEHGRDLTLALGNNTCILMRGHGAVIAGQTLKEAVVTSIYLKINAQIQTAALTLGDPKRLTSGEIEASSILHKSPLAMDRMWEAFCLRANVEPI